MSEFSVIERMAATLGLPAMLVLGIGWFFVRYFWPWWVSQFTSVMNDLVSTLGALREESRAQTEVLRQLIHRVEAIERRIEGRRA